MRKLTDFSIYLIIFIAIVLILFLAILAFSNDIVPQEVLDQINQVTIKIFYSVEFQDIYHKNFMQISMGSAVFISNRRALTVMHIAANKYTGELFGYVSNGNKGKEKRVFNIVDFEAEDDLALIETKPVNFQGAKLAQDAKFGEPIIFAGYNAIDLPKLRFGFLSENKDALNPKFNGYLFHPVFYGDSGGGGFNIKGELVGIMRIYIFVKEEKINSNSFMGYMVPLEKIKAFLEGAK